MACRVRSSNPASLATPPKCSMASDFFMTSMVNPLDMKSQTDLAYESVKSSLMNGPAHVHLTEQVVAKAITLADRVSLAMKAAGIGNPNQLARSVKVTRQTVYYWLDGKTKSIDSPTLKRLADIL